VLVRAVLESRTLGGAIEVVCSSPRSASINLLIGQAFDAPVPGEVIDVEVAPGDVGFLHPVDGVITHANHFESSIGVHDTLKDLGGSSFFRAARARRLLGASPGVKEIHAVLADHGGLPRSICRHDADAAVEPSETLSSVVLHLDERRMAVTAGPPCVADGYADVRLDGVFA
jgi:isopenicillin-N N-acyltransferase-like protein